MMSEKLVAIFEKYNGNLTTKIAEEEGINKETLRKAHLRRDVNKVMRGGYTLPDTFVDDYFLVQSIHPKGIISHESAAMLLDYGSFSPFYCYMTFPRGYNNLQLSNYKIKASYIQKDLYDLSVTEVETWFGNRVKIYDRERTVLDMLASGHSTDENIKAVLRDYLEDENKDLEQLSNYAEQMNRSHLLEGVELKNA